MPMYQERISGQKPCIEGSTSLEPRVKCVKSPSRMECKTNPFFWHFLLANLCRSLLAVRFLYLTLQGFCRQDFCWQKAAATGMLPNYIPTFMVSGNSAWLLLEQYNCTMTAVLAEHAVNLGRHQVLKGSCQ